MSYYTVREEQLIKELKLLEKTQHPVVKGNHLESLLKKFLEGELPKKYSIGSGFVIGLAEQNKSYKPTEAKEKVFRSKEIDVIIFDEFQNTRPLRLGEKSDFYVEATKAVISVKKHIGKTELISGKGNVLNNLVSAKKILPHSFRHRHSMNRESMDISGVIWGNPIISIGFGYEGVELKTINKYLREKIDYIEQKEKCPWFQIFPDIITILGKGILYLDAKNKKYNILGNKTNALENFFVQLLLLLDNKDDYIAGTINYAEYL